MGGRYARGRDQKLQRQEALARIYGALHVVERFTRVNADTIHYEFTVDDPNTWTRPWSAEIPMVKTEGRLFEYGCHEGNHDIRHILEIHRNLDRQAADPSQRRSK
jgi:hypothetical protein